MRFTDETSRLYFTRLSKLAGLREKIGAYESAEPLYLQALQLRKSTLGEEHPEKHLNDAKNILDKSQSWQRKRESTRTGSFRWQCS